MSVITNSYGGRLGPPIRGRRHPGWCRPRKQSPNGRFSSFVVDRRPVLGIGACWVGPSCALFFRPTHSPVNACRYWGRFWARDDLSPRPPHSPPPLPPFFPAGRCPSPSSSATSTSSTSSSSSSAASSPPATESSCRCSRSCWVRAPQGRVQCGPNFWRRPRARGTPSA